MQRALAHRPVADGHDDDPATVLVLRGHGDAGGYRQASPDDRILAEEAVLGRGQQRGAAAAAVQTPGPLADLAEEGFEWHAARDRPAVAPVRRDDPVVGFQGRADANRNRFLAEAQMDGSLDEAGAAELKASFLELPDDTHAAVEVKHVRIVRHHNNRSSAFLGCCQSVNLEATACPEYELSFR